MNRVQSKRVRLHDPLEVDIRRWSWVSRNVVDLKLFNLSLLYQPTTYPLRLVHQAYLIRRNGKDTRRKKSHDGRLKFSHYPGKSNNRPKTTGVIHDKFHHLSESQN